MLKLFLSSHGHLASGMKSSVQILTGNTDMITVFDAYITQESVEEKLDEFFAQVTDEDQVVLLSDLYGGSVNQVMMRYLDHPNTMLVAGVNLAIVLELAVRQSVTESELNEIVEQSQTMLRVVKNGVATEEADSQEDFF